MNPKTQKQAVLKLLIDNKFMTPLMFVRAGLISYHQRIGDLRKDIPIKCEDVTFTNKYGHPAVHGKWSILNKKKARELYRKLWKSSK